VSETKGASFGGCPTCSKVRYLTVISGDIVSSENIADVLDAKSRAGHAIDVDHAAISHLLHDGLVPQPRTVYRDVFAISVGFSARLERGQIKFQRSFPFALNRSRGDQVGSPQKLLDLLAAATSAACDRSNNVLLLSSGLDSTALAVAAKHAGRDNLQCVTYGEPDRRSEVELARAVCRRLGLRHEAHVVDVHSPEIPRALLNYASRVPEPCADPALIATISTIGERCDGNSTVLDGSGSDSYFWAPPRSLDLLKVRLGLSRLPAVRDLRGLVPFYMRHERLLSTPLEPYLLHGPWLRHCDSIHFYPESADTHHFWLNEFREYGATPDQEARFVARATYVGPGAHMKKTRNAALAVGAGVRFPWSDAGVAAYCFHLPENHRFDRRTRKSKILVREMLRQTIGYDDETIGKRPFLFAKRRFLQAHKAFCREQIVACALWSRSIEKVVERLAAMLDQGRPTENALLALLMVSLWHNHWFANRPRTVEYAPLLRQTA
jgi:asparagine synthetase B (glutamine-hydrolysing)